MAEGNSPKNHKVESTRARGCRPHDWSWWSIVSAHNQNVTADLEFIRLEIEKVRPFVLGEEAAAHRGSEEAAESAKVLQSCDELLEKCVASHRRVLFKNPLFIRQSILVILQQLILIMPHSALHAAWASISQRYSAVEKKDRPNFDGSLTKVNKYFEKCGCDKPGAKRQPRPSADDEAMEHTIRELMREIRLRLDDRVYIDYWSSVALQQKLSVLAPITIVALLGTVWMFVQENCGDIFKLTCAIDTTKDHTILTTTLAGLLGGAISALTPSGATPASGTPPLVQFVAIRPLIGAAAGFFLAIVASETMSVNYPLLYAAAIAFGFSERAFIDALTKRANQISTNVGQAIGQPEKDKDQGG